MFSCVFGRNSQVKVGARRWGPGGLRLGSLIERRQQHGKDSSHNSDTEAWGGGVGPGEGNRT